MHKQAQQFLRYIAANVRKQRLRLGLTQEQLAQQSGIDLTYIQRIERASINTTIEKLVLLAETLELTPGMLLRPAKLQERPVGRPRSKIARPKKPK